MTTFTLGLLKVKESHFSYSYHDDHHTNVPKWTTENSTDFYQLGHIARVSLIYWYQHTARTHRCFHFFFLNNQAMEKRVDDSHFTPNIPIQWAAYVFNLISVFINRLDNSSERKRLSRQRSANVCSLLSPAGHGRKPPVPAWFIFLFLWMRECPTWPGVKGLQDTTRMA